MTKDEKWYIATIVIIFISLCFFAQIACNKNHEIRVLESDKAELQTKINLLKVDIESSKNDLKEAHEMAGLLFLESMAVTDSYNELKKTKCKGIR